MVYDTLLAVLYEQPVTFVAAEVVGHVSQFGADFQLFVKHWVYI